MQRAATRLVKSFIVYPSFLAFGLATGCFTVHVGEGDLNPFTYDETFVALPDLSTAADGDVEVPTKTGEVMTANISTDGSGARVLVFTRDLVIFDDTKAAFELDRFGPSKISAIQDIKLQRESGVYEGLDTSRVAPPSLTIGSVTLRPADSSVDLDAATVSRIKSDMLVPQAVVVPLLYTLVVPAGSESALGTELHVTLVLQPILSIDGTSAL